MIKNRRQFYYYYYYAGGSWEGNRQTSFSKEQDLFDLTMLIDAATNLVFQLAKSDFVIDETKKWNKANQEVKIYAWAEDIEIVTKKEVRDLKMGILPEDDFQSFWRGMDGAGLNGVQLRSKVAIWWNLIDDIGVDSKTFDSKTIDSIKEKFYTNLEELFGGKSISNLLDFVKSILKSVANFFAPEVMDKINELIDFIKLIHSKLNRKN